MAVRWREVLMLVALVFGAAASFLGSFVVAATLPVLVPLQQPATIGLGLLGVWLLVREAERRRARM